MKLGGSSAAGSAKGPRTKINSQASSGGHSQPAPAVAWGQVAKVLRGGSWNNNDNNARASNRNDNDPNNQNDNIGLRCVGSAAGAFFESQVLRVYGRGASAQGEHSRPVPGWADIGSSTKDTRSHPGQ
jgi:hypothetical protein